MKQFKFIFLAVILATVFAIMIKDQTHDQNSDQEFNPKPEHIDDRLWHRMQQRDGKIEPSKMIAARKITQQKLEKQLAGKQLKDAGIAGWSWKGPGNIGGRIRTIEVIQNDFGDDKIFIGAAGGGIWRSLDEGETWSAVDDFMSSLAVTSIVKHPTNNNILYAATGEGIVATTIGIPGAGIFKSTNGGSTWSQLPSTANNEFYWVNKIAVNPDNGNHLLAVTADLNQNASTFGQPNGGGTLKESLNGGATWTTVLTTSGILTDVDFHPNEGDQRTVSGYGEAWLYDKGSNTYSDFSSTELASYPGRIEIAMAESDRDYMYAQVSTQVAVTPIVLYQSTDAGVNWQFKIGGDPDASTNLANYANTIWVDPLDKETVYSGALNFYRVDFSGASATRTKISDWTEYHNNSNRSQLHADQHTIVPSPTYSSSNRKVFIGNDGGIQSTNNISAANANPNPNASGWVNLVGTTLGVTQFYHASASPHSNLVGGGTQDNSFVTGNATGNWFQHNTGDGSQVLFNPDDSDVIYANTNYNGLWRSTDGGDNYSFVSNLGSDEANLIAPIELGKGDTDWVYMGGEHLWKFDNSTNATTIVKSPISGNPKISVIEVSNNGVYIFVGYTNGVVEFSNNAGTTWSGDITPSAMPNAFVTDIAIDPFDLDRVLISFGGYRQNNVWEYINTTSINRSLDFDMQVNSVSFHPMIPNWIYLGTDVGIFGSEDGGLNYKVTPLFSENPGDEFNNEGPVYTEVTDLFWDFAFNETILHAATFGRGIWQTSFSVQDNYYVNQDVFVAIAQRGTTDLPFGSFRLASSVAGNTGSGIRFLSAGTHEEITGSNSILLDKRIKSIKADNGTVIIE